MESKKQRKITKKNLKSSNLDKLSLLLPFENAIYELN